MKTNKVQAGWRTVVRDRRFVTAIVASVVGLLAFIVGLTMILQKRQESELSHVNVELKRPIIPVFSNGLVYALTTENHLSAFDAGTGALKWISRYRLDVPESMAVDRVIIVCEPLGNRAANIGGILKGIDLKTGKVVWKQQLPGLSPGSQMLISAGKVYITGINGILYALDEDTGASKWTFHDQSSWATLDILAEGNGTIYFGSAEYGRYGRGITGDYLLAINASTGTEVWRYRLEGPPSDLAFAGGTLFINISGSATLAIEAKSGAVKWRTPTPHGSPYILASDSAVLTLQGSNLVAQDPATGTVKWTSDESFQALKPLLNDDMVFISGYGGLEALDANTGEPRWFK